MDGLTATSFVDCASASPTVVCHGTTALDALPLESLLCILSHLGTRDVGACAMTGRTLASACDDRSLWTRLYDREQFDQEVRWRVAATSVASAISLCSDWTEDQICKGKHNPQHILAGIVDDIGAVMRSPWHSSIDLVRLLGHPRFACAARASVRVLMDSLEGPSSREITTPVGHIPYASVGTIIRCAGARYMCRSRVMIQHGFFDADGSLCGPGLTHFHWHHDSVPRPIWLGCVGSWDRGRVTACDRDGDAVYGDGCRYRGGIQNGLCHGRGRIYDSKGAVLVAGQWRRNVAHGPCSWSQNFYELDNVQTWVANAPFADGTVDGPIAYFASGRLVMRVPRPYPRCLLVNFVRKCAFLAGDDSGWSRIPDYTTVHYGPSGVTITSDTCLAHRWTDGAITLGVASRIRYPRHCTPRLLVTFGRDESGQNTVPLLIALGGDSTFIRDPHTLAATMRAGQRVDARYRSIVDRDPPDVTTPPGLGPDVDTVGTYPQGMVCGGDDTDDGCVDDHSLSQEDFVHAIASTSPARVGLDETDESNMSDDVRATSIDLLYFLDTATAPPVSTILCAKARPLRGGRVRNALYVASSEPVQKTSDLDMSHCALRECVIVGVNLKSCDFRHARFERCVFFNCSFERCAFFGATFADTQFETCWFAYSHLSGSRGKFAVNTGDATLILAALGATAWVQK